MLNALQEKNDQFRKDIIVAPADDGELFLTPGIAALSDEDKKKVNEAVKNFSDFDEDNDPHKEHDFGKINNIPGIEDIFWKIDYFDNAMCQWGAEDPMKSYRVLTILLAMEF